MPGFANLDKIGIQPIGSFFVPDTVQREVLGIMLDSIDNFYGGGQVIYLKAAAATLPGVLCTWDNTFAATAVANTANLGVSLCVALTNMAINTFGWFMQVGTWPVSATASVAAGTTVGITATGQIGANSAGKQVLNAKSVIASAGTVVKSNVGTVNGSPILTAPNTDGLFVGMAISGTGIPASTFIGGLDPDGRRISMTASNLSTAALATATGAVTLTGTYTGFNVLQFNYPCAQGAIT